MNLWALVRRLVVLTACLALAASGVLAAPADHQARQSWPIELGVSGGSIADITSLYCCGGTLGALVQDADGNLFILSNNHVIGRSNQAQPGEAIVHPGMIDVGCKQIPQDTVANFVEFIEIRYGKGRNVPLNEVDAAIALIVPGAVDPSGAILSIGPVSSNIVSASVGQAVQKSGRTTGHTFGTVAAVGVTVDVGYSDECGGAAKNVARFINQIRITDGSFSAGGDSGSVIFESGSADPGDGLPRAVGLLFAGSSSSTLANPISAVLNAFDVTMAGGEPAGPPPTGSIAGVVSSAAGGSIAGATVSVDTGQSATTNSTGNYTISNVPTGSRTVTASAGGHFSQSQSASVSGNATTTANFTLDVLLAPSQSLVDCITYTTSGGKNNDKDMAIAISIVDDFGSPVAGAAVAIDLSLNGASYGSGSGATTNTSGVATYRVRNAANGTYSIVVTSVASSLAFEGSTPANSFAKGTASTPSTHCRTSGSGAAVASAAPSVREAVAIKARNDARLFALEGVVGTGVGVDANGRPVIEIYLDQERPATRGNAPAHVEGLPTRVVVTGPFVAY